MDKHSRNRLGVKSNVLHHTPYLLECQVKTFIYGLIDTRPKYNHIRYVGYSKHPCKRYIEHLHETTLSKHSKKHNWLRKMLKENYNPKLIILEEIIDADWQSKEIKWIKHYREKYGILLTNTHDGGNGSTFFDCPEIEIIKRKMSRNFKTWHKHNKMDFTKEIRAKMSESAKNRKSPNRKKTYHLISPNNNTFVVVGGLKSFCLEQQLSLNTLKRFLNNKVPIELRNQYNTELRRNTSNWFIQEIDIPR